MLLAIPRLFPRRLESFNLSNLLMLHAFLLPLFSLYNPIKKHIAPNVFSFRVN